MNGKSSKRRWSKAERKRWLRSNSATAFHDAVSSKSKVDYSKPETHWLVTVSNEFFTGEATWVLKDGILACRHTTQNLRWMIGMTKDQAKLELTRLECHWHWQKLFQVNPGELEHSKGCVPMPLVNQHSEIPAKPSEVLPSNGPLPKEQARPGESSRFLSAAPERHSGDCQLTLTSQRPSTSQLYR